ncbi:MAG TPA: alpha/beta hydrolase [Nannocystis sp.]|jgi:pimeloyl-ACP methyl ester carboxylesterase
MTTVLVLLPGMDGTGRMFAPLLARLPATLDARPIAYPCDRELGYAELLGLVRQQLPRGDFFVLAESFSGPLALRLAGERPRGLCGLILAASFAASPLAWLPRWSHGLAHARLFGGLGMGPRLALGLGRCPPAITPMLRDALALVSPAVMARRAREVLRCEAPLNREALAELPALLLGAERDRLIGRRHVGALQALLPRAQVEWFDAPHLLLQARPDEAAEKIAAWIGRS